MSTEKQPKVLVIHALRSTSRQTTIDHLLAFRDHLPNASVQFLHFAQPLPKEIADSIEPDLLIINYDFLNYRFSPLWPYIKNRHRGIARRSRHVVALAQDDFWAYRLLDNWCSKWNIDRVLTPIENDLEILYPRTIHKAEFKTILTGYAPTNVKLTAPLIDRPIDLGQRVRTMSAHLGIYAQAKSNQVIQFGEIAKAAGFQVDVSAKVEDSFIGSDWSLFLEKCKFTVSMKGGASIADPYGLLYTKVESIRSRNPEMQVTAESLKFLQKREGRNKFKAISPRLFDAAAAGTCQILSPDNYLNVLEPWVHYIPLKGDKVGTDAVLKSMLDLSQSQEIANRARARLIESGDFSYRHLVDEATINYLDSCSDSNTKGWNALANHLKQAAELCTYGLISLHDAALSLLFDPKHNDSSAASKNFIIAALSENKKLEWFNEWQEAIRSDEFVRRLPWLPRLIPST